jgi:DNA-binding HxlR family transcriptional regulator
VADWTDERLIRDAQVVFHVVSGRWTLLVLAALERGPRRHNDLRRAIEPIHSKVLNETLHRMTDQQLLIRDEQPGVPPAVFYELSEHARALMQGLEPFLEWVGKNSLLLQRWQEQHRDSR